MPSFNKKITTLTGETLKLNRRTISQENRIFQPRWKLQYFVCMLNENLHCLVCYKTISVLKEYNIKRHYDTNHNDFNIYTGKLRKEKLSELEIKATKQQVMMQSFTQETQKTVSVSYELSYMIAKASRPFQKASL